MIAGIVLALLFAVVIAGVTAHEVHLARARRRQAREEAARASARRLRRVGAMDHHESDTTMLMPVCLKEPASDRLERKYRERGPRA